MLTRRLRERTPSAIALGIGFVEGCQLTFNKVSVDGSGKCTLEPMEAPGGRAYGVLFRIAAAELPRLDKAEGLGIGYRRIIVEVMTDDGSYKALTYIATKTQTGLLPYDWYKEYVVRGAVEHRLPPGYIDTLRLVESKADPDARRSAEHLRCLSAS